MGELNGEFDATSEDVALRGGLLQGVRESKNKIFNKGERSRKINFELLLWDGLIDASSRLEVPCEGVALDPETPEVEKL